MEEIRTRARLVDPAASSLFTRGLSTMVPRSEIEEALHRGEYPAPLFLDIARVDSERDDEVTAHARVMIDWDEPTLQELLRTTSDSKVRLSFDPDELRRALEGDEVDAHGMREKMAVIAVAAAAAGAGAGAAAAASPIAPDYAGAPGATVHSSVATDAGTGGQSNPLSRYVAGIDAKTTAQTPSFTSDVAAGGTGSPANVGPAPISDVASGGTGSPASDALSRYVSNVGSDVTAQAPAFTSDVAAGGTGSPAAAVTPSFTSDVAAGGTGSPQSDVLSRYVSNVGDDAATAPEAGGSGSSISLPSPAEGAGIAAGIALLITGAGFAAVRSRRPPELPA